MNLTTQADVVIVGCGAGGLATAVELLLNAPEMRVLVLERTTRARRGGNTAWTGSFFRLDEDGAPAADFTERMRTLSRGKTDESIIHRLAELAQPTLRWLNDQGVATKADTTYFLTSRGPRLMPVGGGAAIVETLASRFEALGGTIEYETAAQALLMGPDDAVAGVEVSGAGTARTIATSTVVLASGGFEGNSALLDLHLGVRGHELPTITPGGRSNQGEGIEMARQVGAGCDGQFDRFHGEPVDPRSGIGEALVMVYPYGVLVDHRGQRFLDEGSDTPDNTFESVAYRIWAEADQFAYVIADQKLMRQNIARAVLTDRKPESADTIGELARRLGIDDVALGATIECFNRAATPGPLDLTKLDGVASRGLEPPKSNWARPINEPPYVAWPVTCAITFTFGGVRTDAETRVLRDTGDAIVGLHAVGEVAGIYHHEYPGATSVLRALVFGRVAAQHIASCSPRPISSPTSASLT